LDTIRLSKIFMGLVTIAIIAYDIWVAVEPTRGDTISEIMSGLGYNLPIIPYAWGVLMAHFFARRTFANVSLKPAIRYTMLIGSGILVGALSLAGWLPANPPLAWFIVGAIAGYQLWPQFHENFRKQ